MRYWQDLQPGESFITASLTVTQEDILEFAAEFDPQPYHLDSSAARESIFGELCASGWQVTASMMRLITDILQAHQVATLGSSGVRQLRWKIPVFVGDTLSARLKVVALEASEQAGLGAMDCEVIMDNQHGKAVLESTITLQLQLRSNQSDQAAASHG
jgi:acyl dehydratase